ncbi:hypothetical protein FOL47_001669 [Perkinsus chesapeaki]|uniref:Uncharacterized protein n=1 Tax=Perkinsus chesapeaki TaxID=330153 RepID=A0A7J6MI65_PERCH|nr:hypothetical protein FOL47_001669 [Perkinsus chesapeaki]
MAQRYYTELRTSPMTLAGLQHSGSVCGGEEATAKMRPDLSSSFALGSMHSRENEGYLTGTVGGLRLSLVDSKRADKSGQSRQDNRSRLMTADEGGLGGSIDSEGPKHRKSVLPSQLAMGSLSPGVERKADGLNFGSSRRHFTSSSTDLFSPTNGNHGLRGSRKRMQIERPRQSEGDRGMGIFPTDPRSSSNLQTDGNVAHLLHMLSAPSRGRFAAKKAIPASYSTKTLRRKADVKEAVASESDCTSWMGRGLRTKYSLPRKETGEWMSGLDHAGILWFRKLHTFDFVPRNRAAAAMPTK